MITRRRRLIAIALVVSTSVACSVAAEDPSSAPPSSVASADQVPSAPVATPVPSPSRSPSASIPGASGPEAAIAAAAWLLDQSSARFDLRVDRFRPSLPDEAMALASGAVDPAGDRGTMRYDIFPDDSRLTFEPFDITWDPDDYWTRTGADGAEVVWRHTTRAEAPEMAMIGRVNEEPLALLRLAAAAEPATIQPLPDQVLDGVPAERWLVPVPAARARDAWIPPDTYLGFETIFGLDALPLEIWLVDGRIARVGYVLEREKAPYGGPDRHETWYAWTDIGDPIHLEIPPAGKIVEAGS